MSNDSYLCLGEKAGPPIGDEQVLGADYFVPVLWLATLKDNELKRWVDPADEDDEIWYFELLVSEGLARCESREKALHNFCTNIDEYLEPWLAFLRQFNGKILKIDVTEIIYMDEEAEDDIKAALTFLDNPDEKSAAGFINITCISDVYDSSTRKVITQAPLAVSEIVGQDMDDVLDKEFIEKQVASRPVQLFMTGYKIAPWITQWDEENEPSASAKMPWWKFW